jgi:cellulose synthase/poly-beta-1,6-N-acetylglucosamine synthase-like glycosyltransferase
LFENSATFLTPRLSIKNLAAVFPCTLFFGTFLKKKSPELESSSAVEIEENRITLLLLACGTIVKETLDAASKLKIKYKNLRTIKDLGQGKPAALNLAVKEAKGDILILSDGDVYVSDKTITEITKPFKNEKVGAVSGNVISLDSKKTRMGYWAHILTNIANELRQELLNKNKPFFCTGYLFAIRKKLFPKLPEELLSEDGYISFKVYQKKYTIKYTPNAKVYVKFPTTFKDWIIQKKRSTGGYNQIKKMTNFSVRSFGSESSGIFKLFKYITNIKELFWFIELVFARIYLWIVIYRDINIKKKSQKEIWKRVESTK